MIIDLRDIDTYYINIAKHKEKNNSMIDLGNNFGFKNYNRINAVYNPENPITGCASSHYNILKDLKKETIILEDDCIIKNNQPIIKVPNDADAVYLGLSQWGYRDDISKPKNFDFKKHENVRSVYKISSMLSTHAILYINKEYMDACARVAKYSMDNGIHIDQGFARIQRYYNVYAVSDPIFYQNSNRAATNFKFSNNKIVI
jgi:hypothetical protein